MIQSASRIASRTPGAGLEFEGVTYILCIGDTLSQTASAIFFLFSIDYPVAICFLQIPSLKSFTAVWVSVTSSNRLIHTPACGH